jgi:hypothetical protein
MAGVVGIGAAFSIVTFDGIGVATITGKANGSDKLSKDAGNRCLFK